MHIKSVSVHPPTPKWTLFNNVDICFDICEQSCHSQQLGQFMHLDTTDTHKNLATYVPIHTLFWKSRTNGKHERDRGICQEPDSLNPHCVYCLVLT